MTTKEYDKAIQYGEQINSLGYKLIDNPGNVLRVDYENSPEIILSVGYGNGVETYREYYYGTTEDLGGVYYGENSWNKRTTFTLIRLPRVYLLLAETYALKPAPDFGVYARW